MVHGDEQEFLAEYEVKQAHTAVEQCGFDHLGPGDGENISDQHILEMLGLPGGFAHQQNSHSRSNGIGDADKGFLGDMAAASARKGENGSAEKGEGQTDPVGTAAVRIHPRYNGYDGA